MYKRQHVERYAHQVEVLRRLHAQGAALYVATNESIAHTANWQAEKRAAHLGAKLRRLEAFAESLGEDIPLLVVIALTNKEGDCHKRGPNAPTGMWRAVQKALNVSGEAHTYIGDLGGGNGRERDDRRFAEANGLAFHTEVEFFEGRHPASSMEESPAFEPVAVPAPEDFPAPAPRVASDQVEFGLDYVDTQTQDELAPERPDCPAPEPQLPPFELVPVDSQTQAEAAPPPDEFPAPEPRTPSAELPPFEVVALDSQTQGEEFPAPEPRAPFDWTQQDEAAPAPAPWPAETYPETYTDEDPFADIEDPRLRALLERQTAELPRIVAELEAHGEKRSHWAWWAFPTELCGASEPYPETRVTPDTAAALVAKAPAEWRLVLARVCDLSEARGALVLPAIDHGRVASFVAFWGGRAATPAWLARALARLEPLLPPAAARQLAKARGRAPEKQEKPKKGGMLRFLERKARPAPRPSPSRSRSPCS